MGVCVVRSTDRQMHSMAIYRGVIVSAVTAVLLLRPPNSISIGSGVSAWLTSVPRTQTETDT